MYRQEKVKRQIEEEEEIAKSQNTKEKCKRRFQ